MIGLEIVAPKGLGFVSSTAFCMEKGSNGYNNPSVREVDGCEKIKGEPTRMMVTVDNDGREDHFFSCIMTDASGNITPWSGKITLKKMVPQELAIPADGGSAIS
jgi:hypothetical protein